jgi:hypothetical protein
LINPWARASLSTALMPFLLMVLTIEADTFKVIQRFSSGIKKRFFLQVHPKSALVLVLSEGYIVPRQSFFSR